MMVHIILILDLGGCADWNYPYRGGGYTFTAKCIWEFFNLIYWKSENGNLENCKNQLSCKLENGFQKNCSL